MSISTNFTRNRPRACTFFAGRAWYAGVPSPDKSGWVLFSQVATDPSLLNKCYQKNDPTSEVLSDLLDDDGGVIPIPDAGEIFALRPIGNAVVVFASKGVWSIRGGDSGFKATDYSVDKITSAGCISAKSVVSVEDTVFYWSTQGIYAVGVDQTGIASSKNISDNTIKNFYNNLSIASKTKVVGVYNNSENIITWAYCTDPTLFDEYGTVYKNAMLKFDVKLQCFYTESISDGYPHITSLAVTKEGRTADTITDVLVGDSVVYALGGAVYANISFSTASVKNTKYLTFTGGTTPSLTFSEYDTSRNGFKDWGGLESSAYVVTGYSMGGGGPARQKTAPMLTVFAKRTEEAITGLFSVTKESSIKMQTRWDFTNNTQPNKWSTEREVYRHTRPYFASVAGAFDNGYPLVITKNKLLGRGKALQIKWQAGENKDMQMAGWSINFVANSNV